MPHRASARSRPRLRFKERSRCARASVLRVHEPRCSFHEARAVLGTSPPATKLLLFGRSSRHERTLSAARVAALAHDRSRWRRPDSARGAMTVSSRPACWSTPQAVTKAGWPSTCKREIAARAANWARRRGSESQHSDRAEHAHEPEREQNHSHDDSDHVWECNVGEHPCPNAISSTRHMFGEPRPQALFPRQCALLLCRPTARHERVTRAWQAADPWPGGSPTPVDKRGRR